MHEWNFVVDMFVKDHEKYNGGCQPVTLSIRQGSDTDVSSAISDRLFLSLSLFLSVCLSVCLECSRDACLPMAVSP